MRHAASVRQQLGFRTLFNWVGPLANPARATFQLLGVGNAAMRPVVAEAAGTLGVRQAFVVHGSGMDEVSLSGPTQVTHVSNGHVTEEVWHPEDFGLPRQSLDGQQVSDCAASARLLKGILCAEKGPATDLVLANASAVLKLCGRAATLVEGVEQARETLQTNRAQGVLQALIDITHEN